MLLFIVGLLPACTAPDPTTPADVVDAIEAIEAQNGVATAEAVDAGRGTFNRMSCHTCHGFDTRARTGPPLHRLFADPITLDDGTTLMADRAYVAESILMPDAKQVAGYPSPMSNYGFMSAEDVAELVLYLESRSAMP
jgi:cytochrome c oxidase subunit 2